MTRPRRLIASVMVLGACRALAGGTDEQHRDPTLGIALTVPAGWQVTPLAADDWRLGIASPSTQERARAVGQPADNPRYQDVLVGRAPTDAPRQICRGREETLTVADARAMACDSQHAVGSDPGLLVAARDVFVPGPHGLIRLATEGESDRLGADRRSALEAVLQGLRLLP